MSSPKENLRLGRGSAALLLFSVLAFLPRSIASQVSASNQSGASSQQSQLAQPSSQPQDNRQTVGPNPGQVHKKVLGDFEFWLSFEILGFGLAVVATEYRILRNAQITAEETLRVYAVTLIIIGTLFSITAGFDANQIAPAMGLFGTIAGYLLGKRVGLAAPKSSQEESKE